jgi:hypothetical protein
MIARSLHTAEIGPDASLTAHEIEKPWGMCHSTRRRQ